MASIIQVAEGDKERVVHFMEVGIDLRADKLAIDPSIDKGLQPALIS